ncbi:MAG: hypothetical protein U9O78_03160 [Patescibacteria group bacterium]|nr:hypothetical protein [Patescibacteria group bacterium]
MITLRSFLDQALAVDSIWSVVFRGAIWLVIAVVILISTDNPDPEASIKKLKSNLGFFVMFIILSGGLIYLLFGFTPTLSASASF